MENERWKSLPSILHRKNERLFCWEGFQIKSSHKGLRVFATTEHSPGLMLPYGGIESFVSKFGELMNRDQICSSYMVNGRFDRSKILGKWLDAIHHPKCDVPSSLLFNVRTLNTQNCQTDCAETLRVYFPFNEKLISGI